MADASSVTTAGVDQRERVMRAAVRLARSRGYHGTSVDRLAADSGVRPEVVTELFPDRVALLEQVLERAFEEWYREVPTWQGGAPRPDLGEELERRFARGVLAGRTSADFWHLGLVLHLEPDLDGRGGFGLFLEVRDRVMVALGDYWSRILPQDLLDDELLSLMASAHLALVDGSTVAMQASPHWDLQELMSFVARGIATALQHGSVTLDHEPSGAGPRVPKPSPGPSGHIPRLVAHATLLAAHEYGPQSLTFEVVAHLAHRPVAEVAALAESPAALAQETLRQGYEQWRDSVPSWQPIPPGGSLERALTGILRDTWHGLDAPDLVLGELMLLQPAVLADSAEAGAARAAEVSGAPATDARSTVVQLRDQSEDEFTAWFRQAIERDPAIGPQERGTDRLCARLVILAMDGFVLGRHLGSPARPDDFRAMLVEVVMGALRS